MRRTYRNSLFLGSLLCLFLSPLVGAQEPAFHWKFEGIGSSVVDSGPSGVEGELKGESMRVPGVSGQGLGLDGVGAYLRIEDSGTHPLDLQGAFTISIWLNPEELDSNQKLISKDNVIEIELGHAGLDRYSARFNNMRRGRGSSPIRLNRWQQIVVVWDTVKVHYYLDGRPDGAASFSGALQSNDADIGIGARPAGFFKGMLDEIQIFDRALSATEVASLYASAANDPAYDVTPPIISVIRPSPVLPDHTAQVEVAVSTDEPASCRLAYEKEVVFEAMPEDLIFDGSEHRAGLDGLATHVPHEVYVLCRDEAGNIQGEAETIAFSIGETDSLVAYWSFDETSGSIGRDASRYGHDASAHGEIATTAGIQGQALHLTQRPSFLQVEDIGHSALDLDAQLTIAAWIQPRILFNERMIVSKDNVFELAVGHAGFGRYSLRLGNLPQSRGETEILEDVWQHLTVTWDGEMVRYYYDGRPDGEHPFSGTLTSNDTNLGLGARPEHYFWGNLDEIRIYDRALDSEEVTNLYRTSLPIEPRIQLISPDGHNNPDLSAIDIRWSDSDPDDDASIALYYSTTKDTSSGTLIVSAIKEDDPSDTYRWDLSGLPMGGYYIYATIDDGEHPVVTSFAPGSVNVGFRTLITVRPSADEAIDGLPVTYEAVTDPSGYEEYVDWSAHTERGATGYAIPERGSGPTFTTTWALAELDYEDESVYWFAIRAGENGYYGAFNPIPDILIDSGAGFSISGQGKIHRTLFLEYEAISDIVICLPDLLGEKFVGFFFKPCCPPTGGTRFCWMEYECVGFLEGAIWRANIQTYECSEICARSREI